MTLKSKACKLNRSSGSTKLAALFSLSLILLNLTPQPVFAYKEKEGKLTAPDERKPLFLALEPRQEESPPLPPASAPHNSELPSESPVKPPALHGNNRPGERARQRNSRHEFPRLRDMANRQLDLTPLGLSPEQKSKIQQMRELSRPKARELQRTLVTKRAAMRDLIFNPTASEAQIRSTRNELRKTQEQLDDINLNEILHIRSLLTPEQRNKLPECKPSLRRNPKATSPEQATPNTSGAPPARTESLKSTK